MNNKLAFFTFMIEKDIAFSSVEEMVAFNNADKQQEQFCAGDEFYKVLNWEEFRAFLSDSVDTEVYEFLSFSSEFPKFNYCKYIDPDYLVECRIQDLGTKDFNVYKIEDYVIFNVNTSFI